MPPSGTVSVTLSRDYAGGRQASTPQPGDRSAPTDHGAQVSGFRLAVSTGLDSELRGGSPHDLVVPWVTKQRRASILRDFVGISFDISRPCISLLRFNLILCPVQCSNGIFLFVSIGHFNFHRALPVGIRYYTRRPSTNSLYLLRAAPTE